MKTTAQFRSFIVAYITLGFVAFAIGALARHLLMP